MIGKETNTKKQRPNWDDYYLNIAKAISERATCMRRRYGAVIVDTSNAIVSSGYNGSPVGAVNCIDRGICKREEMHIPKGERYELCEAIHAEQNAIINCTKQRMIGATIYIYGENVADGTIASGEPCLLCARMIKNAGITRVVASTPIGDKKADCAPKPSVDKVSFHDQNGNSKVIDVSDINKSEKPDLNKKPKVIKAECAFAHGKKAKRKSLKRFSTYMSENAQDTKTKPVVGIDAMAVRIMTDITFNNNKIGCCTYIPTSQKAIFFRSMIDKFGALNCDGENAYSTKTNAAKISIRTYLVPAEEVTACGAGAAIDKVREVFHEGFQEFMRMPINHKAYELNPVTVSFYAINKDNTYEKAVNVSVAIGDFDNLIASINRIVEAYHYSPVFLAKNVNCPNIFPGSEKYTEGNKTYSYQRDGHFDIVVVTNKATIPTTLISLADAVTAIASIVVGC